MNLSEKGEVRFSIRSIIFRIQYSDTSEEVSLLSVRRVLRKIQCEEHLLKLSVVNDPIFFILIWLEARMVAMVAIPPASSIISQ